MSIVDGWTGTVSTASSPRSKTGICPGYRFAWLTGSVLAGLLNGGTVLAQEREAKVIGPQTPVEQYDPQVLEPEKTEPIDFPKLMTEAAPGDDQQVIPELRGITLEFVNDTARKQHGDFPKMIGSSRVSDISVQLYSDLKKLLSSYEGLPVTMGDLRYIQRDISDVYLNLGLPLMSVFVPPQEVTDGQLLVQINEFSLADLEFSYKDKDNAFGPDNAHWSDDERLQRIFQAVVEEPVLSKHTLDEAVGKVNRNPFRSARVVFEPAEERSKTRAAVQIDEKRQWGINAGYNNHATETSGTHRYSFGGYLGNFPQEDQQLSVSIVLGPDVEEFENYSLTYRMPNRWGHSLSLNGNYSDTASSTIPGIGSASTTLQISAAYEIPVIEKDNWSVSTTISTFYKQFERESLFGGVTVAGAEFDAWTLVSGTTLNWKESTVTNQLSLTATQSFSDLGGNNTDEDFRRFYNRVSGDSEYLFFGLNYARVQQLATLAGFLNNWSTETQLSYQFASDELAGSDQFALGGAQVLRAYESSALAGDRGGYLIQFIHFPAWQASASSYPRHLMQSLQFSVFYEAGRVWQEAGGDESLTDFGLQAKLGLMKAVNCSLSLGVATESIGITQENDLKLFAGCNTSY